MHKPIWADPSIIVWSRLLLDSYRYWTGRELMHRTGTAADQARDLYHAPFISVSHGTESDPILNYGNKAALQLWEMEWEEFTRTPSRLTAEPMNREERERMLEQARRLGYLNDYRGIRISKTGRRFLVEHAVVWTVLDAERAVGQAAMFSKWTYL